MKLALLSSLLAVAACGDALAPETTSAEDAVTFHGAIAPGDFGQPLDRAHVRALQTWLDDAAFATKWTAMTASPLDLLGGADSAWHADLATLPRRALPGREVLCHGDPKLDNFGWQLVDGATVFSDNDFDDADPCPVAADALHYTVATELQFADPRLTELAIATYAAAVASDAGVVTIDPALDPDWASERAKGLAKDATGDALNLGGEVQPATAAERAALADLVAHDPRMHHHLVDAARDVRTDGGSAGWRRFWLLVDDGDVASRTIVELKEEGIPGPRFGRQTVPLDDLARLVVLKLVWWGAWDVRDHFTIDFDGATWLVRDRLTRTAPKKLTAAQRDQVIAAEASLLAVRHRRGWGRVDADALATYLRGSTATLAARWRAVH